MAFEFLGQKPDLNMGVIYVRVIRGDSRKWKAKIIAYDKHNVTYRYEPGSASSTYTVSRETFERCFVIDDEKEGHRE